MRFIYLSLFAFSVLFAGTSTTDANVASAQAGSTFLNTMGNGDKVNTNLSKPIMGGSQMKTIDGKTSFDAQIQCPSSAKAVAITFLPVGSNEYRLMIQQDSDLDGKFDYIYDTSSTGRSVSGVCSNGVIMCNPAGSWTSCQPYIWTANSNKQISLAPVDLGYGGLGSCFCSNASCGVSTLAEQIYDTIGSGISTTIMRSDSRFILSKNEYDPANMAYYLFGQNKVNCSGLGASAWDQHGEQNPTHYFDAQTPPNTSIGDIALEQGSDPNSYYSMISNQSNVAYNKDGDTLGMPNTVQCTIKKTPVENVTTIQQFANGVAYVQSTGDYSYCNQYGTHIDAGAPGCGVAKELQIMDLIPAVYQDYSTTAVQTAEAKLGYQGCTTSDGHSWGGHAIIVNGCAIHCPADYTLSGRGGGAEACVANVVQKSISLTINNGCASSENTCTIQDEQMCDNSGQNCVYTIKNGIKQQIQLSNNCTTGNFSTSCANGGAITSTQIDGTQSVLYSGSDAWFTIKRTYNCGTSNVNIDASKQIQASGTATKTDNTSATMTYTDMNGTTQTISALPTADSCLAPSCMVKRPKVSDDVFYDKTNRSQLAGGSTVYETVAKTCTGSGSSAICPVDASLSETMIDNCSCPGTNMRGFQQAVTNIGVVSEASKDMICSQN